MTNGGKVECIASGRFLRMERKRKFRECVWVVCVCGEEREEGGLMESLM